MQGDVHKWGSASTVQKQHDVEVKQPFPILTAVRSQAT